MRQFIPMLTLLVGLIAAAACGTDAASDPTSTPTATATQTVQPTVEVEEVTFDELLSDPDRYRDEVISLDGFFFDGFETTVLSERMEYSGFADGHLWPKGQMIWIENNPILSEIYGQFFEQTMIGPTEHYGIVHVEGRFEHGGGYGHGGGFVAQIVPTAVKLLPWSPPPTPTPTPSVAKEWDLDDIQVEGSTVTVALHVFSSIDVRVTLDGKSSDELNSAIPNLEFVFTDVAPGKHLIEVKDVVGFADTAEVLVTAVTSEIPDWLLSLIKRLESEPVSNPPASITRYEYNGQTVYFIPQRCCDIFSDLYDSDGTIIGHPDGGITGQGDGRVPDFFEARTAESVVWHDKRT